MDIVKAYPPNYNDICAVLPVRGKPGVIFTYGDTIYNPQGIDILPHIRAHEAVHKMQQGDDPAGWWERYLADPQFRFDMEWPAHVTEYRAYVTDYPNRSARRRALATIAKRIASPLYGRVISFPAAKKRLQEEAKDYV